MHATMLAAVIAVAFSVSAMAKLPAPSEEQKAAAAETAARNAHSDKLAQYKLCLAMDRTAEAYRKHQKAEGKTVPTPVSTEACQEPGPFATPTSSKPREASEAHSPSGPANAPPSTSAPHAELGGRK
jgi:hypothetical protein